MHYWELDRFMSKLNWWMTNRLPISSRYHFTKSRNDYLWFIFFAWKIILCLLIWTRSVYICACSPKLLQTILTLHVLLQIYVLLISSVEMIVFIYDYVPATNCEHLVTRQSYTNQREYPIFWIKYFKRKTL